MGSLLLPHGEPGGGKPAGGALAAVVPPPPASPAAAAAAGFLFSRRLAIGPGCGMSMGRPPRQRFGGLASIAEVGWHLRGRRRASIGLQLYLSRRMYTGCTVRRR